MLNYSWDKIYPFEDCYDNCCDRICIKQNIMILSSISKLQTDYGKLSEEVKTNTNSINQLEFRDIVIDFK